MKTLLMAVAIMCTPACVPAAPVYLDCSLASESETREYAVKLDEDSGKITHTWAGGSAFNAEGFFAANTISYQQITVMGKIGVTLKIEIDRTNLTVKETTVIKVVDPKYAAKIPPTASDIFGLCEIATTRNRKI
jgi:hypothetical protein